jgi:hypothetical protein
MILGPFHRRRFRYFAVACKRSCAATLMERAGRIVKGHSGLAGDIGNRRSSRLLSPPKQLMSRQCDPSHFPCDPSHLQGALSHPKGDCCHSQRDLSRFKSNSSQLQTDSDHALGDTSLLKDDSRRLEFVTGPVAGERVAYSPGNGRAKEDRTRKHPQRMLRANKKALTVQAESGTLTQVRSRPRLLFLSRTTLPCSPRRSRYKRDSHPNFTH